MRGRIARALREEFQFLNLRLIVAGILVSLLPGMNFSRLRTAIYRLAGIKIGRHSLIFGRLGFTGIRNAQRRLIIGANAMINEEVYLDMNADIRIGDGVSIGHHVMFITADHEVGPSTCRAGPLRPSAIQIGAGTWIGARSTIMPGVTIGAGCIVAAGSLVSGNVPPHRVVGGVPARPLRSLPDCP